mmetsp:Transcript_14788/g.34595  ORF Transcript_14788/g.34595 Transcript_14788/m.34595 type:complete len:433 (+) Transcript_14788:39-1337(+)|eukprot:CAMPEP_0171058276 /NCGR_PEP_ID=MMETSP0766_2-20121228/2407_1 /TAXON_ID=439317 /ORGANISM="Gambierdiscus australes, Strain CAWD 149" /LENGTH=432 /DNA_ID=CAMNT_0011513537 /DNA_START=35 /DNA_END=1333 /DNA_ORIENTATION=+
MEAGESANCQDWDADDPVEECSDGEAFPTSGDSRCMTHHGVGVTQALETVLEGADLSGRGGLDAEAAEDHDDIVGASATTQKDATRLYARQEESITAGRVDAGLTQELEAVIFSAEEEASIRAMRTEGHAPLCSSPQPCNDGDERGDHERAGTSAATVADVGGMADAADAARPRRAPAEEQNQESEASDEDTVGIGLALSKPAAEQELIPDEGWMTRPSHERELWERMRPRALRHEAAQLRALRFPTNALSRLMRLHPALQVRSAEASDLINYSTLLVMQAVVLVAARGKDSGQRVQFEDVRQTCSSARELQFLHPLSSTLDASAHTLGRDSGAPLAEAGVEITGQPVIPEGASSECHAARSGSSGDLMGCHAGGAGKATSNSCPALAADVKGTKRKAATSSTKKAVQKAPRVAGGVVSPSIARFFRPVGAP